MEDVFGKGIKGFLRRYSFQFILLSGIVGFILSLYLIIEYTLTDIKGEALESAMFGVMFCSFGVAVLFAKLTTFIYNKFLGMEIT